jgi:hypothetical protein
VFSFFQCENLYSLFLSLNEGGTSMLAATAVYAAAETDQDWNVSSESISALFKGRVGADAIQESRYMLYETLEWWINPPPNAISFIYYFITKYWNGVAISYHLVTLSEVTQHHPPTVI